MYVFLRACVRFYTYSLPTSLPTLRKRNMAKERSVLSTSIAVSSTSTTHVQAAVRQSIIYVLIDLPAASEIGFANRLRELAF